MYADVARRHGLACDEAALGRAMAEVHAALPVRVGGGFRYTRPWFERFIAEVFARAGAPVLPPGVAPDLFAAFASAASFRVFEEVPPLLEKLRRAGLRLAVVSNWSPELDALLDGLGLAAHFDVVVSSGSAEVEKPAHGIFTLALARLDIPAEAALHVGDDRVKDLEGARAAGLRAALLDRSGRDASAWSTLAPLAGLVDGNPPG
jgi:putative hydrolase of the HAD superfamily